MDFETAWTDPDVVFWFNNTDAYAPEALLPSNTTPDISLLLINTTICFGYGGEDCYAPINFANSSAPTAMCILSDLCATTNQIFETLKIMAIDEDIVLV